MPTKRTETQVGTVFLETVGLEEIIELRYELLIKPTTYPHREFDGDHDPTTLHFRAVLNGRTVSCASCMQSNWEGSPASQLRGMATVPELRSLGLGGALLKFCEECAAAFHQSEVMWCNAQLPAKRFYARHGYSEAGKEFTVEGVGPHIRMFKRLRG
ncbi:MAG: GNAT family N-acetyltransferase [Planctomycetota bacterium]